MRVAVVGAGIVGVCTAYELAADGHEVVVFERRSAAAEETSFANAGVVAPGYVTPWAAPGMPAKVFRGLFGRHAAVRVRPALGVRELAWVRRWWAACAAEAYWTNRARLQRLAFYSRDRLHELAERLGIDYERASGYLVLLRSEREQRLVEPGLALLKEAGVRHALIDGAAARAIEPALDTHQALSAAIHLPDDEVGNCRQFAHGIKREAERLGARFEFGRTALPADKGRSRRLRVANAGIAAATPEERDFDHIVLCAGVASADWLVPMGVHIPLVAVHGYSVTAALRDPLRAPISGLMDERYKVAISRIGQRVRVAGSAELGGTLDQFHARALATLYKVLDDWYPGSARLDSGVQVWKGARPTLPDGPPLIGTSGIDGLWLNLGHGSSGWALACGSARLLADQLSGRPVAALTPSDYDWRHRFA